MIYRITYNDKRQKKMLEKSASGGWHLVCRQGLDLLF